MKLKLLICVAILLIGHTSTVSAKSAVIVEPAEFNFDKIPQGAPLTARFLLSNPTERAIEITELQISLRATNSRVKRRISPGEHVTLELTVDTTKVTGVIAENVMLTTDEIPPQTILVKIAGHIVPAIEILPLPAVYLSQFHGDQSSRTFEIRNNQDRPLGIRQLEPTGDGFEAKLEVVEPGKVFLVTVTGAADKPVGRHHHFLIAHTDDPDRPKVTVEVNILVKPEVYVSVEQLDFGGISISQLRQNPSAVDLLADQFVVTRREGEMNITAMRSDLSFLTLSKEPEVPTQTFTVRVGLEPDKLVSGEHQGTVTLGTDDPQFPKLSLPVRITITE